MRLRRTPSAARRRERILASPRFDGRVFRNTHPVSSGLKPGVERPTMKELLRPDEWRVPSKPLPVENPLELWGKRSSSGFRLTWLGHSSLMIELDGMRILTDPVWSKRASPLPFAGPRRFHPPVVALAELPPLDAILLSHDHYDHLDRKTVVALAALQKGVPIITSLGVGARLERWKLPVELVTELDWWETAQVGPVTVTACPAQHFSGRALHDRNRTLWASYHFRGPNHSFFFGADGGLTSEFADIGKRLGPFDAVALEIAAYHPAWGDIHLGPDNAMRARELLGSGAFLPIHWGTFNLAIHPWSQPADKVYREGAERDIRMIMPKLGAPTEVAQYEKVDPWWREISSHAPRPLADERAVESTEQLPLIPD
jgi:L-ascorbate metabolism protein UlaG (beta-lactamase superfamily)